MHTHTHTHTPLICPIQQNNTCKVARALPYDAAVGAQKNAKKRGDGTHHADLSFILVPRLCILLLALRGGGVRAVDELPPTLPPRVFFDRR
jgi:hypothetical protein